MVFPQPGLEHLAARVARQHVDEHEVARALVGGEPFAAERLHLSGGENIYCAEVENVLAAHPKIAEVALIGVPDAKYGEAPLAVAVARDPDDPPTTADVEAFCREQLAAYKRPRDLVLVAALPRNPSGKVLKTRLRDDHGGAACPT